MLTAQMQRLAGVGGHLAGGGGVGDSAYRYWQSLRSGYLTSGSLHTRSNSQSLGLAATAQSRRLGKVRQYCAHVLSINESFWCTWDTLHMCSPKLVRALLVHLNRAKPAALRHRIFDPGA